MLHCILSDFNDDARTNITKVLPAINQYFVHAMPVQVVIGGSLSLFSGLSLVDHLIYASFSF